MKKAPARKSSSANSIQLRGEYQFDYSKAKANRFASRADQTRIVVVLDSDVSDVFSTSEAVNKALRALIAAMPKQGNSPKKTVIRSR